MRIPISSILIFTLCISNIYLIFLYFQSLVSLRKLSESAIKLLFTNSSIEEDIDIEQSNTDIHKESFIKFLSDSRDWAFEYIDKSQKQIKDFIELADKEFAFFDSYGNLSEEYPHYKTMKTISEEYKKLKSLLPEENNDRR